MISMSRTPALVVVLASVALADTSPRLVGFSPRDAAISAQTDAHRGRVMALAFLPDGRGLLSIGADTSLKTWTPGLKGGDAVERQFRGDRIEITPDGKHVVGLSPDNQTLVVWDRARKEAALTIPRAWAVSKFFALSPDGKSVAMMQNDATGRIFSLVDGTEKTAIGGVRNGAGAMAWSKDGKKIATVGFNRAARIVDPASGEDLLQLEGVFVQARDLVFSPDSKLLAISDIQGSVRLYDVKTGREMQTLAPRQPGQKVVAFSPDGRYLAAGDTTGAVKVYDVKTGKELRAIPDAHTSGVHAIAFSPDGTTLATGGGDGKVRLWGGRGGSAAPKPRQGKPGWLGITGTWDDNLKGALINSVVAGSAAEKAGLQEGDVLLEFGGKAFEDFEGLRALVTSKNEGDDVELKVNRGGEEKKIKIKLGAKPDE